MCVEAACSASPLRHRFRARTAAPRSRSTATVTSATTSAAAGTSSSSSTARSRSLERRAARVPELAARPLRGVLRRARAATHRGVARRRNDPPPITRSARAAGALAQPAVGRDQPVAILAGGLARDPVVGGLGALEDDAGLRRPRVRPSLDEVGRAPSPRRWARPSGGRSRRRRRPRERTGLDSASIEDDIATGGISMKRVLVIAFISLVALTVAAPAPAAGPTVKSSGASDQGAPERGQDAEDAGHPGALGRRDRARLLRLHDRGHGGRRSRAPGRSWTRSTPRASALRPR